MITVVVLDVNETLFSLDAVGAAFAEVGLDPGDLPLWFARVLRDGFAAAATDAAVAFPVLARHHLRVLADAPDRAGDDLDRDGILGEDDIERVIGAFAEVRAHPDVAAGLRRMDEAGLRLVAFTNGSAGIVSGFLERTGLDQVVTAAYDVSAAGRWKPHPASYRWICDRLGVAPADAAMLAVHPWDVAGAMGTGMLGAWLDRDHARWPGWLDRPDCSARSMVELADTLASRAIVSGDPATDGRNP